MCSSARGASEIRASFVVDLEDIVLLHRYTVPIEVLGWPLKVRAGAAILGLLALAGAVWLFTANSWALTPKAAALGLFGVLAFGFVAQTSRPIYLEPVGDRIPEPGRSRLLKMEMYKNAMGPQVLTVSERGLSEEREHATVVVNWSGISRVITTPTHTFFVQSTGERLLLLHSALAIPVSAVIEAIEGWWGRRVERPDRQPHLRPSRRT